MESGVNIEFLGEEYQNFDLDIPQEQEREKHAQRVFKIKVFLRSLMNRTIINLKKSLINEKKFDKKTSFARKGSFAENSNILKKKTNRDEPKPKEEEKIKS